MRDGMVHNVASDAHDDTRRPPGIAPELEQAGFGPLSDWLTRAVPGAILAGTEIPPRPVVEPRRREAAAAGLAAAAGTSSIEASRQSPPG